MLHCVVDMGLDTVELVIRVEETFGISIPDERAGRMQTVGDLYDCLRKESSAGRRVCLSAAAFYAIRRAIRLRFGAPDRLHPEDSVDAALPRSGRRAAWRELERDLELRLPDLSRPVWLVWLCGGSLALSAGWVALTANASYGPVVSAAALTAWLLGGGIAAAALTLPFATLPGPAISTFGSLSDQVLALNYARLSAQYDSSNPSDLWKSLRLVIVDQLGVKPHQVTKAARWVDDLGAD